MSLSPIWPGDVPVHLLEGGDEEGGEEEPRHDPLLGARHGDGAAGGERGGGHARLLSRSASSSTRPPRESRLRHSSESGVPSRLPAFQRRWRSSSASRKRVHVVGRNDDAGSRVAHELRGRAVGRDGGEDRPLGREVLEDLPGQDAPAAAARLRDQEEQRLGVPLQLERAAARDVAEQLDAGRRDRATPRTRGRRRGSRRRSGRRRRRGRSPRARAGTASGRACRGSGPACVIRRRSLAWCSRPAKSSKSQPFAIVTTLPFGSSARISSAIASDTATIASACEATSLPTPPVVFSFSRASCDS